MGKKSSSQPSAPDPYKTAEAEAQFDRVNTYSPNGTGIRYGYTDKQGNFRAGVKPKGYQAAVQQVEGAHDATLRSILEPASIALTNRVVTDNISGMPDAARVQDRGTVAQDIFDRNLSMLMPQFEKGQDKLIQNLQARGIPVGSEAFTDAYSAQQRETEDTLSRLAQDANINAGQEQSRLFSLDSAARQNSIAELVAAMGGGYTPAGGQPSGAVPGSNYSGLVGDKYKADLANYNSQQQQNAQTAGAIGSLGAGLFMKCTETAKDVRGQVNTQWAVTIARQLDVKAWTYKEGQAPDGDHTAPHIGPMAERFHELTGMGDGKTIPYVDIIGLLLASVQGMAHEIDALVEDRNQLSERLARMEHRGMVGDAIDEAREIRITGRIN